MADKRKKLKVETTTLILKDKRFEIPKQKLINKSRYFATLFSTNFNDHLQPEHVINYNITENTMQNFVNWIRDDSELELTCYCYVKPCMKKFFYDYFKHLMELLQLSVLFVVDDLTEEVTSIIEACWLIPRYVIEVWLLAQDLSLTVLQDICLSVCLDRFNELHLDSICDLSKSTFMQLVGNVNVRSTRQYLNYVTLMWYNVHKESLPKDITGNKQMAFLQTILSIETFDTCTKIYIQYWNGSNLVSLIETRYPQSIFGQKYALTGMQTVGRGFSIYFVGGEFGIGTGRFQTKLWRYSLISKKWFCIALMQTPRRHMVAAFHKSKLLLVGGVGRHRIKLDTVEIFDIHACTWSRAARVPTEFTDVPAHCVHNGKLVLFQVRLYVYYVDYNIWKVLDVRREPPRINLTILTFTSGFCYFENTDSRRIIFRYIIQNTRENCFNSYCQKFLLHVNHLVDIDNDILFRIALSGDTSVFVLGDRGMTRLGTTLHLHNWILNNPADFRVFKSTSSVGLFRIIDPSKLHTLSCDNDDKSF